MCLETRQGSSLNPAVTPPGSSVLPSHSSAGSTKDSSFLFTFLVPGLLLANVLLPVHVDSELGATFEGVSTVLHSRGRALRWLQQDKHCVLCALRTKLALSGTRRGPWGRTHEWRHTSVLLLCTVLSGRRHSQHVAADNLIQLPFSKHREEMQCISALLSFTNLSVLGCIAKIFLPYLGVEWWGYRD